MSEFNAELEEKSGTILETVVENIVEEYHKEHPTGGGITQDELAQAITEYFTAHPIDTVSEDEINSIVEGYFNEHPVSGGISKDDVLNIIDEYENGKNLFEVKEGTYTQDGVTVVAQNNEFVISGTADKNIAFADVFKSFFPQDAVCMAYLDSKYPSQNGKIYISQGNITIKSDIELPWYINNTSAPVVTRLVVQKGWSGNDVHIAPVIKEIAKNNHMTNFGNKIKYAKFFGSKRIDFQFENNTINGLSITREETDDGELVLKLNGELSKDTTLFIPIVNTPETFIGYAEGKAVKLGNGTLTYNLSDTKTECFLSGVFSDIQINLDAGTYNDSEIYIKLAPTNDLNYILNTLSKIEESNNNG